MIIDGKACVHHRFVGIYFSIYLGTTTLYKVLRSGWIFVQPMENIAKPTIPTTLWYIIWDYIISNLPPSCTIHPKKNIIFRIMSPWNVSSPRFPYVLNPSKVHWKAHILVESREISLISTYLLVNFTIFHHTCWSLTSQRSIGWLRAPQKPRAPACRQMWAADSLERAQSWACQPWQWWLARLTIPPLQSRYKSISIGKIIFGTACFRFSGLPTRPKGGLGSWFSLVVP